MQQYARTLFAGLVLTGISIAITACQQAPAPVAAAPAAPSQVVVEERHPPVREEDRPRAGVDVDIHKRQDGDHASVDVHAQP